MNIVEYRKISQSFRRVASNMLTTKYENGNIQLIRFRRFIQENELISNIIQEKIKDIECDYKKDFIVKNRGWYSIAIPIDEGKHIKAMYDYLVDITNEEKDIRGIASKFYHSSDKWDDMIREYLDKVFKPLVDFIVDSLSIEMIGMESVKQETHIIHQSINTNYGTASIAQGDINSVNNATLSEVQEIKELVESLKCLIVKEKIDEEVKEEVIDDLETIEAEINSEKPKHIKIKKASQGIKNFISKIPQGIATATVMTTQGIELYEKLKPFIKK